MGEWVPYLQGLGGIPIGLVEELYRVNRDSVPIAENPRPANVVVLPADYAPPDLSRYDERCLMGEYRPDIEPGSDADCDFRAYYTVSRVAFSHDRRYALLTYRYHCVPLCGREDFVAFKWDGRRWQRIGRRTLWIS